MLNINEPLSGDPDKFWSGYGNVLSWRRVCPYFMVDNITPCNDITLRVICHCQ